MEELRTELLERPDSEKGERGRVGAVAGSVDRTGPPALVGEAALRAGSDLVKVLTSEGARDVVAGYSENLIVNRYLGDHLSAVAASKVDALDAWSDVMVIGPGLAEPDQAAVRRIVSESTVPIVVDADAIEPALDASFSRAVFTPDGGEVERIEAIHGSLASFAEETGAVVVSTGPTDEVVAPEERFTNETGSAAMTVGGTGDVLAGVVASMIGQGLDRLDAARLGAWSVGVAGEQAADEYGIGLTATDVVERVPRALSF